MRIHCESDMQIKQQRQWKKLQELIVILNLIEEKTKYISFLLEKGNVVK